MINRAKLKRNARAVMRRSYWAMLWVSLIGGIFIGDFLARTNEYRYIITSSGEQFDNQRLGINFLFNLFPMANFLQGVLLGTLVFIFFIGIIYNIFIGNAIEFGVKRFFLQNIQREDIPISVIFSAFKEDYWNIIKIMFVRDVKLTLWSFLFYIPKIIKAYEYQMVPYLLAEDSSMSIREVFARTKEVTRGKKADLWILDLSFLGWYILDFVTLGLTHLFFINPYQEAVYAEAYMELKEDIYME